MYKKVNLRDTTKVQHFELCKNSAFEDIFSILSYADVWDIRI